MNTPDPNSRAAAQERFRKSLGIGGDAEPEDPSAARDASAAASPPFGVAAFFGTWPGDETDEELLAALAEIRR